MDDATLRERTLRTLAAEIAAVEHGAPDGRVVRHDGVLASLTPSLGERSLFNAVVYESVGALEAALPELRAIYEDAGVKAWTVFAPEDDEQAATLLESAGHSLDAAPMMQGLALDELRAPPGPEPDWSSDWDLAAAGTINDAAWDVPAGTFLTALGGLPESYGHLYLARDAGEPAAFVLMHDVEDDCGFWFAATQPAARGRGLCSGLLHRALRDGRERGCVTSTCLASAAGQPVYHRLGYRDLGRIGMWERRT